MNTMGRTRCCVPILWLIAAMAAPGPATAAPPEPARPHVAVQDPVLTARFWNHANGADERDGYALLLVRPNILELHELAGPTLIRVLEYPQAVRCAALGPGGRWCIIGLDDRLVREDLVAGAREPLNFRPASALALDASGERLALVRQQWTDEVNPLLPAGSAPLRSVTELSVWDLGSEACLGRAATVIAHRMGTLVWSGDRVLFEGPDEGIMDHVTRGHRWLTTLSLPTGLAEMARGAENKEARQTWISAITAARAAELELVPDRVRARWAGHPAVEQPWVERWNSAVTMAEPRPGELVVALPRGYGVGTLFVSADGTISTGPILTDFIHGHPPRAVAGRILAPKHTAGAAEMHDLARQTVVSAMPRLNQLGTDQQIRYVSTGWLVTGPRETAYFEPNQDGPRWTVQGSPNPVWGPGARRTKRPWLHVPTASATRRLVALCSDPAQHTLEVRSCDDGRVVMTFPGPEMDLTGAAAAFDASGERLAVAWNDSVSLRAVPGGELIAEAAVDLGSSRALRRIIALDGGWWVAADLSTAHVLDRDLRQRFSVPAGHALAANWIGAGDDRSLLIIGETGDIRVADARTGSVTYSSYGVLQPHITSPREGPAQGGVVFGGRVVVRNTGHAGTVELLAASDLRPLMRIQVVPVGERDLGWIAWTPDGLWDASDGAEAFVQCIEGMRPVPRAQCDAARSSAEIRRRLVGAVDPDR